MSFATIFNYAPGGDDPDDEPQEFEPPAWFGPPHGELGTCLPLAVVIGRSERAVVALKHATAFSTGMTFDFVALARGLRGVETTRVFHEQHLFDLDEDPPDAFLRVGFELADGTRVSNLGRGRRLFPPDAEPNEPILMESGGGGGSSGPGHVSLSPGYWLWPLPPPGPLRVFTEWPALDIELSQVELDASGFAEAAGRSRSIWVDPEQT